MVTPGSARERRCAAMDPFFRGEVLVWHTIGGSLTLTPGSSVIS